jgi:hypothetical protein
MEGVISTINSGNNNVTVDVDVWNGTGTFSSWNLSVAGSRGLAGVEILATSPVTATGPASSRTIGITVGSGGVQANSSTLDGITTLGSGTGFLKNAAGTWSYDNNTYLTSLGAPVAPANANSATAYGYIGMPQILNPATGYTISAADAGDHIYMTTSGRTITIPANTAAPLQIGTTIVIVNAAGVTTTISINSDTLILAGTGTTGSRTLAQHGVATIIKITSTSWIISGNGLT